MDREIKFRAWNKFTEEIIDLHKVTPFATTNNLRDDQDGIYLPFMDGIILMQFTGLKDKNGKEIYEGDILQVAENHIYEVCFLLEDEDSGETICSFGLKNKEISMVIDDYAIKTGNVIGNIYKNPELIN